MGTGAGSGDSPKVHRLGALREGAHSTWACAHSPFLHSPNWPIWLNYCTKGSHCRGHGLKLELEVSSLSLPHP